jgi:predicted Zn-dependent protease with MMP-like domain
MPGARGAGQGGAPSWHHGTWQAVKQAAIAVASRHAYGTAMTRTFGIAPTLEDFDTLARAALARLPEQFAEHLGQVVLQIEDFADEELLAELGIDDPFELTGVYEGLPIGERSVSHSGTMPDRIRLFRQPILDEWIARGDETLEHLVAHVLVHEVGHHFGLSDDDMHVLEEQAG